MKNLRDGQVVRIRGNDFVSQDTSAHVILADDRERKILLALDTPIETAGDSYHYAIASPRLGKDSIADLFGNKVLGSAVTWVPDSKFDASRSLDTTWWRGGAAAITDVYIE